MTITNSYKNAYEASKARYNDIGMLMENLSPNILGVVVSYFPTHPSNNLNENIDNCLSYLLLSYYCSQNERLWDRRCYKSLDLIRISLIFKSSINGNLAFDRLFQSLNSTIFLKDAVKNNNVKETLSLVKENAEINSSLYSAEPLLHVALRAYATSQLHMVKILISLKADLFALNYMHQTAAHVARLEDKIEIVDLLETSMLKFVNVVRISLDDFKIPKVLIDIVTEYLTGPLESTNKLTNWPIIPILKPGKKEKSRFKSKDSCVIQ